MATEREGFMRFSFHLYNTRGRCRSRSESGTKAWVGAGIAATTTDPGTAATATPWSVSRTPSS